MNKTIVPVHRNWRLWEKLAFRFFCAWFIIYVFPFPLDAIPFISELSSWHEGLTAWWLGIFKAYDNMWHAVVPWVGRHVLGFSYAIQPSRGGSGDTTYDFVLLFTETALALAASVIWTLCNKKRRNYDVAWHWLRVLLRFFLALTLFDYGFEKVFHLQMPFPIPSDLAQTFGEKSPMGLAWSFVGYSAAFSALTGWAEVVAGLLLLFRRTTTLGALLAMIVMGNVVAINFCYDVPVKLFSSMLFLMSAFLTLPDLERLAGVLILHKPVSGAVTVSYIHSRNMRMVLGCVKAVIIVYAVYSNVSVCIKSKKKYFDEMKRPPLYGIYNTSSFVLNGDTLPPLTTDTVRWKQLIIDYAKFALVKNMNDSSGYYRFTVDTAAHKILVYAFLDTAHKSTLHYETTKDWLELTGRLKKDSVNIRLKKFDIQAFRLVNTGFHWINEHPINQ